MPSPTPAGPVDPRPHVVIVGCGFGGLEAARALRHAAVRITLLERTNHHLFQPLLYQVATAGLAAPSIAAPVRHLFRRQANCTTLLAEVRGVDPEHRELLLDDGGRIGYDHLIVAAGATHSYFGNDAWAPFAPGLKTLDDAFEIRRRILLAFESAEREADPARRAALLTFVVVGAGPTGVELAGTLAEIARHTLPGEFRRIDPSQAQVLLGARVTRIDAQGLELAQGAGEAPQRIASACVVWAAGVAASPLGRQLAEACGAEVDRAGRVRVEPDLSLAGWPSISVVGDLAAAHSHVPGQPARPVPGVSPAAKQMGRCAAANVLRRVAGRPTQPFRYRDYGNLATIGRNAAVVDLDTPAGPLRFSGYFAWLFWLFAHVYFLIGFRNRLVVLTDWASAYWSFRRHARVVTGLRPPAAPAPGAPAGD